MLTTRPLTLDDMRAIFPKAFMVADEETVQKLVDVVNEQANATR